MAALCYSILGLHKENPTLIQDTVQSYYGANIADSWMDRERAYLWGYKNDSWAKYQEGWAYKFYSQFHLVENFVFQKRYDIGYVDEHQNAMCAMAREMITDVTDLEYNGYTLRNNEYQLNRGVNRGDSYAYENIGAGSFIDDEILTFYGVLCDDVEVKQSIVWLREYFHSLGEGDNKYTALYIYKQLVDQAGSAVDPSIVMPKFMFDNANDIITMRSDYTYVNDTIIQIDGGEERGSGHSEAQGYFLYALGEYFLDFGQVPYEDDIRMDVWRNGISLVNVTQLVEGTGGIWNSQLGEYGYNRYYGMQDATAYYSTDYPGFRKFSLIYGGDIEDYMGTSDGEIASTYNWIPYYNADPVQEYFIKFGDMLAKRTIVSGNLQGEGTYHNFINLFLEFNQTIDNTTLLYERSGTNKNMKIALAYSNETLSLGGGETNISSCYDKTSCSGSNRGNSSYARNYYHSTTDNVDFIFTQHWYYDGEEETVTAIGTLDRGVNQGTNYIVYDYDNDGLTTYGDYVVNGWGLVYNANQYGSFNASTMTKSGTSMFTSNVSTSFVITSSSENMVLDINSMKQVSGYDVSEIIRVTLNANAMTNNSNFSITDSSGSSVSVVSELNGVVTFDLSTEQNGDTFTIIGTGNVTPTDTCDCPTINTNWQIDLTDSCLINDDCDIGTGAINFINTGWAKFNSTITCADMTSPPTDGTLYILENALLQITG